MRNLLRPNAVAFWLAFIIAAGYNTIRIGEEHTIYWMLINIFILLILGLTFSVVLNLTFFNTPVTLKGLLIGLSVGSGVYFVTGEIGASLVIVGSFCLLYSFLIETLRTYKT